MHRLETLFPIELKRQLAISPVLVATYGTIEWHSHHLPVGLDGLVARHMGERLAEAMDAVLAPVGWWAVGGVPFPFTLNLPLEQIEPVLRTVTRQYLTMGFTVQVMFTGHFGLEQTLATKRAALREMEASDHAVIIPLTTYDLVADFYAGDHAGVGETSLMLAIRPDLVRLDAWPAEQALPGVIGDDPRSRANAELGRRIINETTARASALVAAFRSGELSRADWIATLALAVDSLERTRTLRQTLPRERVPAPTTADYLQGWAAIAGGRLEAARAAFQAKVDSLQALASSELATSQP